MTVLGPVFAQMFEVDVGEVSRLCRHSLLTSSGHSKETRFRACPADTAMS
jgi:hypothetical protein